jgi:hypothetical protein
MRLWIFFMRLLSKRTKESDDAVGHGAQQDDEKKEGHEGHG